MGTGRVSFDMALSAVFIEGAYVRRRSPAPCPLCTTRSPRRLPGQPCSAPTSLRPHSPTPPCPTGCPAGFIFILVTLVGIRSKLVELIPRSVMLATSAGIGLFLAHIGMQAAEGLGVTTYNSATLVTLGGCAPKYRTHQYTISEADIFSVPPTICSADADGIVTANGGKFLKSGGWVGAGEAQGSRGWRHQRGHTRCFFIGISNLLPAGLQLSAAPLPYATYHRPSAPPSCCRLVFLLQRWRHALRHPVAGHCWWPPHDHPHGQGAVVRCEVNSSVPRALLRQPAL